MNNPLQEHAHLFANGCFKAKSHNTNEIINIEGVDFGNQCFIDGGYGHSVSDCTLIARPIEDMTDDEKQELYKSAIDGYVTFNSWAYSLTGKRGEKGKSLALKVLSKRTDGLIYLLSIGVYPFDQSHFDDGTVIDSTTL